MVGDGAVGFPLEEVEISPGEKDGRGETDKMREKDEGVRKRVTVHKTTQKRDSQ